MALPAYVEGRPGDWNGLQSYVDTVDSLADGSRKRRLSDCLITRYPVRFHPQRA